MFLCAPQGLSGDVEDLEKRPVKKQNYDTDGDTDQNAHQDGGAVAAAGTVQFSAPIFCPAKLEMATLKLWDGMCASCSTFSMAA